MTTGNNKNETCPLRYSTHYGEGDSYLLVDGLAWSYNCQLMPVMEFTPYRMPKIHEMIGDNIGIPSDFSAIGAGPTLVMNGKIQIDDAGNYPWLDERTARTAIGYNSQTGKIYLIF